jgi:hypothetical protein
MSSRIISRPDSGQPERRPGDAVSAALDRLGMTTARRRGRRDRKLIRTVSRQLQACDRLAMAGTEAERARATEAVARVRADAAQDNDHPEDRGRRGLSSWLFGTILVGLWALNLPIAVATFQVFGESLTFTILLALVADAVILLIGHLAGVTLRRAHLAHDRRLVLGTELPLGWCLLVLGVAAALTSGWVRWSYLRMTGAAFGVAGILFTTILAVATFLLACMIAWRHHDPAVSDAERATRRRRRAEGQLAASRRRVRRATRRCAHAATRRRVLAQRIVGDANRRIRHAQIAATSTGAVAQVAEPAWLDHERRLADPRTSTG